MADNRPPPEVEEKIQAYKALQGAVQELNASKGQFMQQANENEMLKQVRRRAATAGGGSHTIFRCLPPDSHSFGGIIASRLQHACPHDHHRFAHIARQRVARWSLRYPPARRQFCQPRILRSSTFWRTARRCTS